MPKSNYKQIKNQEKENKQKILASNPEVVDESGIYILYRFENGFSYAYVGQAKRMLSRLADHLKNFQHIDLSIKKHGLWSENNQTGWKIDTISYPESELNEREQQWIRICAEQGYQLYNHTTGSQGVGKAVLGDQKERKGYKQGLYNGYENARKDIAKLFNKNLACVYQGDKPPTKNQEKAMQKFNDFIAVQEGVNGDN